jgi:hypothetical protein
MLRSSFLGSDAVLVQTIDNLRGFGRTLKKYPYRQDRPVNSDLSSKEIAWRPSASP